MKFSHLHCHTQFSLLDGAADISKLFKKAKADGMPALAITDHGNMFGAFQFVAEAAKHEGVKPIVGCEFYLVENRHERSFGKGKKDDRFHQLFLAKNAEGYRNLVKLCSTGYIEGFYSKYPRIDKSLVLQYHKGLIATTCCLGARVPQMILRHGEAEARKEFEWWLNIFGEDYYVELQRHNLRDQEIVNEVLIRFAKEYNVKIIASNDSHYVEREDSNAHDILLCINTGEKQATPKMDDYTDEDNNKKNKRFAFPNDEFYFKNTSEMRQLFHDLPQAIDNTNEIVAKIDHLKLKKDILLPHFQVPPQYADQDEYLRDLTFKGAKERYRDLTPEIEERLNFELFTVKTMGFAGYFLIVSDFIRAGRDLGVFVGPGRGCLSADAKVVLHDGTTKNIHQIQQGDTVWTHDGTARTVKQTFEYDVNETLLQIKTYYGEETGISLTKDHKVLAEKSESEAPKGNLTWLPASEIAVGDWLFIPKPIVSSKHFDISNIIFDKNDENTTLPDALLRGSDENIFAFLQGYCFADGHESEFKIKFTTVSRTLADQIRFLCWRVGIPASIATDKREGDKREAFKNRTTAYMVSIPKDARIGVKTAEKQYVYRLLSDLRPLKQGEQDGILVKVRSIETVEGIKKVYDFEVDTNHNYLTSSFLVHNSAAGSAVAYCIGITNIDPIKYKLLFERFLNPDRKSMPDIDTDFDDEGRQKVIDYVVEKYGKNQVAHIATYGTMAAKMSIKDVARVMDLHLSESNNLAKLVPEKPGIKLARVLKAPIKGEGSLEEKEGLNPEDLANCEQLREVLNGNDLRAQVLKEALILEGSVRGTGIHAAGIIIAPDDLTNILPVSTAKDVNLLITQFEGSVIEDAGVIKMDFLGLKTLTILKEALRLIKQNHGIDIDLDNIPLDDKKTYELYQRGETNGTFQFESTGMQKYLRDLKPDRFDDLIAMNALYRPGPLAYIPNFINRKHGLEPITYDLPEMEEYLADTYGICVTGDTLIYNPLTGNQIRIDELEHQVNKFYVQGVNENLETAFAPISYWVCNGKKAVVNVKLSNGASVKMTPNHKVLTENGWQEIGLLRGGDFIATPRQLENQCPKTYNREKLRVLAYLLADGSLSSNRATADFISKDEKLVAEYKRCIQSFERLETKTLIQVREVSRVMVKGIQKTKYHETNSLVVQLQAWGVKNKQGGCRSADKFIPDFVFSLDKDDIAFFLASYWDCDGYIGERLCFIKTISPTICQGIQTLLLRLGIYATVYESYYDDKNQKRITAYQITIYNLKKFKEWIEPHLIAKKMLNNSKITGYETYDTVSRAIFLHEFEEAWKGSKRGFMEQHGFSRQHLLPKKRALPRINVDVVQQAIDVLELPQTAKNKNIRWVEIESITPAGEELVYDITVEKIHNFVGNNVILHNCVYQEQVMLLSQKLANFSKGDADVLRKAMGKKQIAVLNKMKAQFLDGCAKNGLDLQKCEKTWSDWEAFASYAFNKSHSTCYAFVAYQTAYLKAHYPAEYMAAVLTNNSGNIEKVTFFMEECRNINIPVKGPDVNESDVKFSVNKKGEIRFALSAIKGVGEAAVEGLIEERKNNGPFADIFDFVRRMNLRTLNKRVIEGLVYAGGFDSFNISRATFFAPSEKYDSFIEHLLRYGANYQDQQKNVGNSLFGGGASQEVMLPTPSVPKADDWNLLQQLNYEREVVGIYLSGHPLDDYKLEIKTLKPCPLDEIEKFKGQKVKIAAFVTGENHRLTKKGVGFGNFMLQDYKGSMEIPLFNEDYKKYKDLLTQGSSVFIEGEYKAKYNGEGFELRVKDVRLLASMTDKAAESITLTIPIEAINELMMRNLERILEENKGERRVKMLLIDKQNKLTLNLYSTDFKVAINSDLVSALEKEGLDYKLN